MIARSDLIILAVSATALAVGVHRWQQGGQAPRVASAPAPAVERVVDATRNDPAAAVAGSLARRGDDDAAVATADGGAMRVRRLGDTVTGDGAENQARSAATAPAAATASGTSSEAGVGEALYGRYRIAGGDYLGKIAERFGTSVATLQSINDLDGATIHVGDELLYPLPAN